MAKRQAMRRARNLEAACRRFEERLRLYSLFISELKVKYQHRRSLKKISEKDEAEWRFWTERLRESVIVLKLDNESVVYYCRRAGLDPEFWDVRWVDACMREWADEQRRINEAE